jgi:hypothetical protein
MWDIKNALSLHHLPIIHSLIYLLLNKLGDGDVPCPSSVVLGQDYIIIQIRPNKCNLLLFTGHWKGIVFDNVVVPKRNIIEHRVPV